MNTFNLRCPLTGEYKIGGGTGVKHTKEHSTNRKRRLAEFYAVTWLWDNGYEVFKNCGCDGFIDLVARDPKGNITLLDVKRLLEEIQN